MPEFVYLNDSLVPVEEAKVSVYDHGFLYGDGIFETMRAYEGKVFCLSEHIDRLYTSAKSISLELPWEKEDLILAVEQTVLKNEISSAYVRLTISRGVGPLGIDPRVCSKPTLVIMAKDFKPNNDIYNQGVKIITVNTKRLPKESLDPQVKSQNFLNNIMAKIETITAGAYEGIMLNYASEVTEGTVSNIFCLKGKDLLTPAAECGILLGVTRETVKLVARNLGYDVVETKLFISDLYEADEAFLTNSSGEVIPVIEIDGRVIGNGRPGSSTLKLLEGYRQLVKKTKEV